MAGLVCIIGYGRIGEVVAELLAEKLGREEIEVYESSEKRTEAARRRQFRARLADTTSGFVAERIARECSVAVTALPSSKANSVLNALISHRVEALVDVSYIPDPSSLHQPSHRFGVRLFVDTGLAPGLSNILAARLYTKGAREIIINVGGISEKPLEPLGIVASWNMADMLEEYIRPARAKIGGKYVKLRPLDDAVKVAIPGSGEFEAIPTDGLRTLINSLRDTRTLIEYTLRYPGHLAKMRFLRSLGLLETQYKSVEGQTVKPVMLLARLLEEKLPRANDRIVMYITSPDLGEGFVMDYKQSQLGLMRPVLSYITGLVQAWFALKALEGYGRVGLNRPEDVGFDEKAYRELLSFLGEKGVKPVLIKTAGDSAPA